MPNRLSKILSRSSKEKEVETENDRQSSDSSPPPSYAQAPPDYDHDNALEPPDVTAGFSSLNLNSGSSGTPQVNQCIAHLKVLECFYRLRQTIGASDGLFGLDDNIVTGSGLPTSDKTPEILAKLSEKRWAIYVSRAVDRFEACSASIQPNARMLSSSAFERGGKQGTLCDPTAGTEPLNFDKHNAPPVDVLMVWHAYMLNPRAYLEDCLRLDRMQMWHTGFPWQAAVDCINSETFLYEAGDGAAKNFTSLTGQPWDNLDDLRLKQLSCPTCDLKIEEVYSTCQNQTSTQPLAKKYDSWEKLTQEIDYLLSSGSGYCDRDFTTTCRNCNTVITHEQLRAKKFRNDVEQLLRNDVPMGGTLLGNQGLPWQFGKVKDPTFLYGSPLPNVLLKKSGLGQQILKQVPALSGKDSQSMEGIRDLIEDAMGDRTMIRKAKGSMTGRVVRAERVTIRRMMSRYWENSSPFALDLVGAVIRQGSFIEKMHGIDWLHSPALPSTMNRLLVKYQRFVEIMKNPLNMAVPTLDVDLAWHTHQLSPYNYMKYTVDVTRQFIDHDDKVAETKLNDAFAWTSKTYQKMYGEPYSECTCWYCEAVRESHTSPVSRLFKTSNNNANEQLHDADQDPRKSVHISAHNAVRPDDGTYKITADRKADELEKQYRKACDRAQKKGRKPPRRDDYYYSDAWGYPVYMPAYSPYIGMYPYMYTPMYYPVTPGCMAMTAGAAGNCCAGTCGGGVAAGSCGGGGGAACAGASGAGGCGGGGGGAGGCGGGGGGGGGGGCGGGGGGGC